MKLGNVISFEIWEKKEMWDFNFFTQMFCKEKRKIAFYWVLGMDCSQNRTNLMNTTINCFASIHRTISYYRISGEKNSVFPHSAAWTCIKYNDITMKKIK